MSETLTNDRSLEASVEALKFDELQAVGQLFTRGWREGGHILLSSDEALDLTIEGGIDGTGPMVATHDYVGLVDGYTFFLGNFKKRVAMQERFYLLRSCSTDNLSVPSAIARVAFDLTEEKQIAEQQVDLFDQYLDGTLEGPLGPYRDPELAKSAHDEKQRNLHRRLGELKRRRREALPNEITSTRDQLLLTSQLKRILKRALPAQQIANAQAAHDARQHATND